MEACVIGPFVAAQAWWHGGMQAWRHAGVEACRHGGMEACSFWRHAFVEACRHAGMEACSFWRHAFVEACRHGGEDDKTPESIYCSRSLWTPLSTFCGIQVCLWSEMAKSTHTVAASWRRPPTKDDDPAKLRYLADRVSGAMGQALYDKAIQINPGKSVSVRSTGSSPSIKCTTPSCIRSWWMALARSGRKLAAAVRSDALRSARLCSSTTRLSRPHRLCCPR